MPRNKYPKHALLLETGVEKRPPPPVPDPDMAISRILDVYERATDTQLSSGVKWYEKANNLATEMQEKYPDRLKTVGHAAGVLAALSPNEGWVTNVRNAWKLLETGKCLSLPRSQEDAGFIIAGFDPRWVLFRGGVNFKVQSFYQNIAEPEITGPVTIDRHAKGILYDDPNIVDVKPHASREQYDFYKLMYTKAAAEVGVMPHQLQAVTWLAWRGVTDTVDPHSDQLQLPI
jgi:hypothetical protein